jgi:hypothetical protein
MKENIGTFGLILAFAIGLAFTGWADFKGKTPRAIGGNKTSGIGFLVSSCFMILSALAFLVGFEYIAGGAFAIGIVTFMVSILLRSPQTRKTSDR